MARSFRLGLVIVALLAGSLALACGGGGGTSDDDGDGNGNGDQPEASEGADGDADGDGDGDGGEGQDELRKLAEEFGVREVKIEYSFSSAGDGSPDDEGTMTLYWKPPDAWRVDISSSGGDVILINSDGTSYLCTSDGGTGQCLESPLGDLIPIPFLSVFTDPNGLNDLIDVSLAGVDVDRSDRTIAGQDATCFSISGTIDGETGATEYCFREDGILLLVRAGAEGSGEFTMEATNVEDSVSDSDLEPPYDVTEIPGLP
jgi:hypothetical protein